MSLVQCPVCGARLKAATDNSSLTCGFCHFHRREDLKPPLTPPVKDFSRHIERHIERLKQHANGDILYFDSPFMQEALPQQMTPYDPALPKAHMIYSAMRLPFTPDLDRFFQDRFNSLEPGGLLYLSTPVKRPIISTAPLEGQINFFHAKCIMLLLEKHGFKMLWRQSRFSRHLNLIAIRK